MQIAMGGSYHESNTFFSEPMTVKIFAEQALHFGPNVIPYWRGITSETVGFLEGCDRFGFLSGSVSSHCPSDYRG
jgi:hypothetical protein